MKAEGKVADKGRRRLLQSLTSALCDEALPGELDGFDKTERTEAATFVLDAMGRRPRATPVVKLESTGTQVGRRRMRLVIVNDDMPFLVDSVAAAIAARNLIIHRLLHPVLCVERDAKGALKTIEPLCDDLRRRESIMYIELDRADSKIRLELAREIRTALDDVRAAVEDWPKMQAQMRADAAAIDDAVLPTGTGELGGSAKSPRTCAANPNASSGTTSSARKPARS